MAMIKCEECGKEISDKADRCPNCGCPVHTSKVEVQTDLSNSKEGKSSGLSITALILSFIGCTFIIGAILAIIDLCKKDGRKKTCSIIALVICGIWLIIGITNSGNTTTKSNDSSQTINNENIQNNNASEDLKHSEAPEETNVEEKIIETENPKESNNDKETKEGFDSLTDAFKQGFEDNLDISEENKENLDSIKESLDEIWNDPEVQDAYDSYKESLKELIGD